MSGKTRLDVLLVDQGLEESRQRAQAVIMSGQVFVDGRRVTSPARLWRRTRGSKSAGTSCPMSAGAG